MPLSRRVANFNRHFTNRVARHIVTWAPGFGLVVHVGRRTGRRYETPVNVSVRQDRYVFALTYGEGDWVRNVLTVGKCELRTRGRKVQLVDPEGLKDPTRHLMPIPARWILKLIDVQDFILMRQAGTGQPT